MYELSKKIVKFNGGLGNQMFQYAFAKSLAKKYNMDFAMDFSWFDEVKHHTHVVTRVFGLNHFNANCSMITDEDKKSVVKTPHIGKLGRFLWRKFKIIKFKPQGNTIYETKLYQFDEEMLLPEYYYYEGYFQNEKYFKDIKPELLNDFTLKDELDDKNKTFVNEITQTNSVSLHVRRGDYITLAHANKIHGLCPIDYYNKAIKYIGTHVDCPHFYLFSDDIAWVKENVKIDYPYTVVDFNGEKDYLDMELMKNCKHNIVANSSFSWWGAWLSQNPNKIVIAPKHWLACNKKCEIVPKEWVKL